MAGGYAGKILRVNLTDRTFSTIDTAQYSDKFFGGNGLGTAIFFDLGPHEWIDGLDPRNIAMVMTGPLVATLAPFGGGRTEHQFVAPHCYPSYFSRSGHGGRTAAMLKYAGWDGIVLEGVASSPVWLNIINDEVTLETANDLWGLDTWKTQEEIWRRVTGAEHRWGEWLNLGDSYTAQRPAVMVIGPGGESPGGRIGALITESGRGAGEGGVGSLWGSKNLKAVSVLGTRSLEIADPQALMDARVWWMNRLPRDIDDPSEEPPGFTQFQRWGTGYRGLLEPNRLSSGCDACTSACNRRSQTGTINDAQCSGTSWYSSFYAKDPIWYSRGHPDYVDPWTEVMPLSLPDAPTSPDVKASSVDALQKAGLDARQSRELMNTIRALYEQGRAGPGDGFEFNTDPLPMEKHGTIEFCLKYLKAICDREGIGEAVSLGMPRFADFYGKHEELYEAGLLNDPGWGYEFHHTLPNVEWALSDLVVDRDNNEHTMNIVVSRSTEGKGVTAEFVVNRCAEEVVPYDGDPLMFDYTWQMPDGSKMAQALETGIYSRHKAKQVAWMRHYGRGYTQSAPACCWQRAVFLSGFADTEFRALAAADAYPRFVKAVTGKNISFADQVDIVGRRIHNLHRVIQVLEGRHRDAEVFSPYLTKEYQNFQRKNVTYYHPETDTWSWSGPEGNKMWFDRDGVETWKTHYYEFEGWDTATGWPTRATLEDLDLGDAADALESAGRLGAPGNRYTGT